MTAAHTPVLLREVVAALALGSGGSYVDGTFGAGGYTRAALAAGAGHAYAFDRDPAAIAGGAALAAEYPGRLTLIEARFAGMDRALAERGVDAVDAIALDIGVSSMQLDQPGRGFSFMHDGPLDMRMGGDGPTAADFVNTADEAEIADVIYRLGDEPKSRRIARAIVADRPLTRTAELARLVRSVCGYASPAARIRRPEPSRRFASTSTTNSASSMRACAPPSGCCVPAGGWRWSASTASRTARSRASCASARAATPAARATCLPRPRVPPQFRPAVPARPAVGGRDRRQPPRTLGDAARGGPHRRRSLEELTP